MTLSEVEILMKELGRHISDHTQIFFGTAVDGRMGNRLSVTLISSLRSGWRCGTATGADVSAEPPPPVPPIWEQPHESPPKIEVEPEPAPVEDFVAGDDSLKSPSPGGRKRAGALCRISLERVRGCRPPAQPVNAPRRKPAPAKEERVSAEKDAGQTGSVAVRTRHTRSL